MKKDTLGTLRARIAELESKASTAEAFTISWSKIVEDRDVWRRRAEVAEAALTEIAEMERRLPNCITTEAKLLRRAIAATRVVVEGQESKP